MSNNTSLLEEHCFTADQAIDLVSEILSEWRCKNSGKIICSYEKWTGRTIHVYQDIKCNRVLSTSTVEACISVKENILEIDTNTSELGRFIQAIVRNRIAKELRRREIEAPSVEIPALTQEDFRKAAKQVA